MVRNHWISCSPFLQTNPSSISSQLSAMTHHLNKYRDLRSSGQNSYLHIPERFAMWFCLQIVSPKSLPITISGTPFPATHPPKMGGPNSHRTRRICSGWVSYTALSMRSGIFVISSRSVNLRDSRVTFWGLLIWPQEIVGFNHRFPNKVDFSRFPMDINISSANHRKWWDELQTGWDDQHFSRHLGGWLLRYHDKPRKKHTSKWSKETFAVVI